MQGRSSWVPTGLGNDHVGESALLKTNAVDAEGTLHSIINDSVHSVDVPLQNPNFQDHEMFSWLHFPIDDALEKGFYADFLREVPGSSVQIVKHSFNQLGLHQEGAALPLHASEGLLNDLLPPNSGFSSLLICPSVSLGAVEAVESCSSCPNDLKNMVAGADAATTAEREPVMSINTSHHSASEIFSRMQATLFVDSTLQGATPITKLKKLDIDAPFDHNLSPLDPSDCQFSSLSQEVPSLPVLKPLDISLCSSQPTLQRNFAHFSSTVAETRASLHAVSASSGPSSIERARQQYGQAGKGDVNGAKQLSQRESKAMEIELPSSLQPHLPASLTGQPGETSRGKSTGDDNLASSHLSDSAHTASNRAMDKLHITEQTATSPSRGSGSSSEEKSGKEAAMALKRRFSGVDDSECQSEDLEETTNSSKKQSKRSRAAEMHNLCERKRRDRINEKLMALRDLMPNSSKTAKASILDEAIEYVKLLQAQLQVWSARTGICIPPALVPSMGMQHFQMPGLPPVGLGMGVGMGVGLGMGMGMRMGMGMGIGMMDANAGALASRPTMLPMPQPTPLPSHAVGSIQSCLPAMSVAEGQEHLQNAHILDPYNIYVPHHQVQMQPSPMNLTMYRNMELYNAYLQGQQQQHQWQQLQQQHQWQLMQQQQAQGNNGNRPTQ